MTLDDADQKITLMDAKSSSSSVFILARRDPRPLMYHIEPRRYPATGLIAVGRNNDRIVR